MSCLTSEGFRVQESVVGYPGRVSIWQCRGLNICHWCSDCHSLKDASLDLERHGEVVDFQTGGPTMSPLLLIYMCWKSNGFYWGKPFHPASSLPQVDIWSYPYDIISSDMGLMWVCGGWWVTGVTPWSQAQLPSFPSKIHTFNDFRHRIWIPMEIVSSFSKSFNTTLEGSCWL